MFTYFIHPTVPTSPASTVCVIMSSLLLSVGLSQLGLLPGGKQWQFAFREGRQLGLCGSTCHCLQSSITFLNCSNTSRREGGRGGGREREIEKQGERGGRGVVVVGERERERERQRHRDRQTDRQTETEIERQRDKKRQRQRE